VKLIGVIGGTGPESTIDYYREMVASYAGIPCLDTTKLHVHRVLDEAMRITTLS
jgi:aspartate/glutamate racemase